MTERRRVREAPRQSAREIAYAPVRSRERRAQAGPAYENEIRYGALIKTTGFNP
jgi:hypothetical protein